MLGQMTINSCLFETQRLIANEWHSPLPDGWPLPDRWPVPDLAAVIAAMLTEDVTISLPEPWHGPYSTARARQWIEDRDNEGTTLLVVDKATQDPVGLIILSSTTADSTAAGVEVRLGYLLAQSVWGQGLASELIAGLVNWCREQVDIASLAGGVARDNPASKRVLEKNGFHPVENETEVSSDEELMRLILRP